MKIKDLPEEEFVRPGNPACSGCSATLALRIALKALGKETVLVVPAGCMAVISGPCPKSPINVPLYNTAFEATAATASGMAAALKRQENDDITVVGWAGDGGTYDIGIQALSGAAERRTDFIYVCYNNEMYSNTGIQRSGATPYGAWTTTTWTGKEEHEKPMGEIMMAHGIPYIASADVAYPRDFYLKMRSAKETEGTRYVEVLAPCPTGWRFPSREMVKVGRLAVESRMWILYEKIGDKLKFTGPSERMAKEKKEWTSVEEYLKVQGRFGHLFKPERDEEAINEIEDHVENTWHMMKKRAGLVESSGT